MTEDELSADTADGSSPNSTASSANDSQRELRRHAEEMVRSKAGMTPESLVDLSPEAAGQVLQELHVHQIELEMQNEELRRTQAELEASRARYFDLYDLAPIGYFTLNAKGIIVDVNLTAADLLNVERSTLVKQPLSNFILPQDQDIYYRHRRALMAKGAGQVWEMQMLRRDSGPFWARFEASAQQNGVDKDVNRTVAWRVVMSDITTHKQIEESLREAQAELAQQERLAAVGQLAAGIAHDFNNILSVVLLHAGLALRTTNLAPKILKHFETIEQQTQRAAHLVQQILDFSRRSVLNSDSLEISSFLREQVEFWRRTISEEIDIQLYVPSEEHLIYADPTRMQQMFANLVLNARDAMPTGGTVRIDVDIVQVTPGEATPVPLMAADEWVRIQISDTGTGIPADILTHIYEPFFTTKSVDKGTGLGLAQVFGIVKQHQGHIDVQSEMGAGTTFTIYLPSQVGELPSNLPLDSISALRGHGETILVVEDDAKLCAVLKDTLENLDYQTLTAANGNEALTLLEQQTDKIDLVVSDMLMPGMGGQALFEAMRTRRLSQPFVILTGYSRQSKLQASQMQGLAGWLQKPPDVQQLAELVARALHQETS